jgi:glycosyltransferase 2 family protein
MRHPIVKRFIWIAIFAVAIYALFIVWSDARKNIEILRAFPWHTMPLIMAAVLVNLLVREIKWEYFRTAGGVVVPRLGSFLVFFSGFSMAMSPGRVGELIKPMMLKEYFDQRLRRTIPLVFAERVSDLLGMLLLAAVAIPSYMSGIGKTREFGGFPVEAIYVFLIVSAVFMAGLIWFVRQKRWVYYVLIGLSRRRRLYKPMHKARKLYFATYPLLTAKNLVISTLMAAFSWSFECIALLLILKGVGAEHVTFGQATFMFCMATIFGGFLFFLPGGIGGFETSIALMLGLLGVAKFQIVPAVFIMRFSTLFFSVALGFLFILFTSIRYHKGFAWSELEHADEEIAKEGMG